MFILMVNYNSCVGTEEGPQEGKSYYRLARGDDEETIAEGTGRSKNLNSQFCLKHSQMVQNNMNEALVSDGVDDESMTALGDEFREIDFVGQGRRLVGELDEDTMTTKLIVAQRMAELEERSKIDKLHAKRIWGTGARDGIAALTARLEDMYTKAVVFPFFEHWNPYSLVLCTKI